MFDKIFNKKKKQEDLFEIPEKKFQTDLKTISKLGAKALQQLIGDQDKYIVQIKEKFQEGKKEYDRIHDKVEELTEKNQVINSEILKMTNEHQELSMKFDNLQNSLELMISENQRVFQQQVDFIKAENEKVSRQANSKEVFKSLQEVLKQYQDRYSLCGKIEKQNKFLKEKITDIELKFEEISDKYSSVEKEKGEYSNLLPELMNSLQELKKERKKSANDQNIGGAQNSKIEEKKVLILKEMETMITEEDLREYFNQNEKEQLMRSYEQLKAENQKANQQITALKNQLNELKESNSKISKERDNLSIVNLELQSQLDKKSKDLQVQLKSNTQLSSEIEALKGEIVEIKTKIDEAKNAGEKQKNQEQTQMTEADKGQGFSVDSQKNIDNSRADTSKFQKEQKESSENSASQNRLQSQYETKINELTEEVNSLKNQLEEKMKQEKQQLKANNSAEEILVQYEERLQSLQQQTQDKISSYESNIAQIKDEKATIETALQAIEQQNNNLTQRLESHYKSSAQIEQKCKIYEQKLIELQTENDSLKRQFKRISEQKQIIQQSSEQNLNGLNDSYQQISKQKQEKEQLLKESVEKNKALETKVTEGQKQIQNYGQTINKLNNQMTGKSIEIMNLKALHQKAQATIKQKQKQFDELCDETKSKHRKYESELNQERIKTESMKRTLDKQQQKLQENQKALNKFYEESMHKDKKITYMEIKLKEYKHMIQGLRKEKDEIHKSYQKKIQAKSGLSAEGVDIDAIEETNSCEEDELVDEIIGAEGEKENLNGDNPTKGSTIKQKSGGVAQKNQTKNKKPVSSTKISASDPNQTQVTQKQSQGSNHQQTQPNSSTLIQTEMILRNKITSYQENYAVLNEQNSQLRDRISELEEELGGKSKQIKSLLEKRQQTLKEIERLNNQKGSMRQKETKTESDRIIVTSPTSMMSPNMIQGHSNDETWTVNMQQEEWRKKQEKYEQKIQKVASKAYKGFDILLGRHQNLYKKFLDVFIKELARVQVKDIETDINVLINKSTDMKDVFQDYM